MRRCKIVDLPQDEDRAGLEERDIVTELDKGSAGVICGSVLEPPRACPVIVWEE